MVSRLSTYTVVKKFGTFSFSILDNIGHCMLVETPCIAFKKAIEGIVDSLTDLWPPFPL